MKSVSPGAIVMHGVGDMRPRRDLVGEAPEHLYALVAGKLREADILFGHLETNFSDRGERQMHCYAYASRSHPDNIRSLTSAGFDVVSYASNHHLDWGVTATLDTLEALERNKIAVVGVGRNIAEARKPAVLERKGTRVAFLNYCSVLPTGYEADVDKVGGAPLRVSTYYEQKDWQPATPPRIVSVARPDDLAAMERDIAAAKADADVVVLSMHWGVHFTPAMIAMYERDVGRRAIDAGADIILGHHAHILKGIDVYKGKVIFHSLGNFGFDQPLVRRTDDPSKYHLDFHWGRADPDYPTFRFPADSRKTIVARCVIEDGRITRVSYLPASINTAGQPEIYGADDPRGDEVVRYMEAITRSEQLGATFSREGDEIVIS